MKLIFFFEPMPKLALESTDTSVSECVDTFSKGKIS
jgi:hypothetical protein